MKIRFAHRAPASLACAALGAVSFTFTTVSANDGVALLSDGRHVAALTNLSQCPDQGVSGVTLEAQDFEPFTEGVNANQNCAGGAAIAIAGQSSTLDLSSISGSGSVVAEAAGVPGVAHAIPRSRFQFTFELTEPREIAISASLSAAGPQEAPVLVAAAQVRIWQQGFVPIYETVHNAGSPDGMTIEFDETVSLEPGVYIFRAQAEVIVDGFVPPTVFAQASYDVNVDFVEPAIPGDLTGDGTVGVPDMLILLAEWGPCADCDDCPADLDENCNVGVSDLLILLANWG